MSFSTTLAGKKFAFYAGSYSSRKASIRLRVLGPIEALKRQGVDIALYDATVGPGGYDAIIFAKSYTLRAEALVRSAKAAGCIVISDVCDSVIERADRRGKPGKAARIIRQFCAADLVTVATAELGVSLAVRLTELESKLRTVPDMLEDLDALAALPLSVLERTNLFFLTRFHRRNAESLHCIWFGKSFGGISGLAHVCSAVSALEAASHDFPVTLTICSDDRTAYRKASKTWGIPHTFVPWTLASFPRVLARQRVAVIPVVQNSYTLGKTLNRPAVALRAGLGVIVDALPSYRELEPFLFIDDWHAGLTAYSQSWESELARISSGERWLDTMYGEDRVAEYWAAILSEAVLKRERGSIGRDAHIS